MRGTTYEFPLRLVGSEMCIVDRDYTDRVGNESYNLGLADRRAQAVRDALVQRGVASARISAHGFGKAHPVADNGLADGRAMNRRVEIVIADDKGNLRGR